MKNATLYTYLKKKGALRRATSTAKPPGIRYLLMIYIQSIRTAVYLFPFLAALLTIPYMIWEYRKFGAILVLRTLIIYSLIFYLMCAYFLTILPLPTFEEALASTQPLYELRPFHSIALILHDSPLVLSDPSTYLPTLFSANFLQVFFNILLVFPFGVYLRYYFKRRWWQVIALSFLLSLSFELIQLSALFGIYPRPYRLFEVDDLIWNTTGGFLGFLCTPLFTFFLPKRQRLDEVAYARGEQVSLLRRLLALGIDFLLLFILAFLSGKLLTHYGVISFRIRWALGLCVLWYIVLFLFIPWIAKGRTVGKAIVRITLVNEQNEAPAFFQLFTRSVWFAFVYCVLPPVLMSGMITIVYTQMYENTPLHPLAVIITALCGFLYFFQLMLTLGSLFTSQIQPSYIRHSHLHNISTVQIKKEASPAQDAEDAHGA